MDSRGRDFWVCFLCVIGLAQGWLGTVLVWGGGIQRTHLEVRPLTDLFVSGRQEVHGIAQRVIGLEKYNQSEIFNLSERSRHSQDDIILTTQSSLLRHYRKTVHSLESPAPSDLQHIQHRDICLC